MSLLNEKNIKVSESDVGSDEITIIKQVIDDGYIGMGKYVKEFEFNLSQYLGRPTVCVSTGTTAIQLALQAVGVGPGDEVLVPSLTYVATYQAISATGAIPVSVDITNDFFTISPSDIKKKVSDKTKAIVPVYYAGNLRGRDAIRSIAQELKLRIIEDAAHAFGGIVDEKLVGSDGDITCFSFDPIKNITALDGGCVVTDDLEVISKIEDLRVLGVIGDGKTRLQETRKYQYDVIDQGWRYHLNNINAAVGLTQLKKIDTFRSKRQKLAKKYDELLQKTTAIECINNNYDEILPHIYVVKFKRKDIRDFVKLQLQENYNIQTVIHWLPNHTLTKYKSNYELPVTDDIYSRILTLPLHTKLENGDIEDIVEKILDTINKFQAL